MTGVDGKICMSYLLWASFFSFSRHSYLEHLGLNVFLNGTWIDLLSSRLGDSNQRPVGYWPNTLTARLPVILAGLENTLVVLFVDIFLFLPLAPSQSFPLSFHSHPQHTDLVFLCRCLPSWSW